MFFNLLDDDSYLDVVTEPEVAAELEEAFVDPETASKLDSAIASAFQTGNFENLVQIINADPQFADYKVHLLSLKELFLRDIHSSQSA